jgi:hypothetical protein
MYEINGSVLCMTALAAVVAILSVYQNKPSPRIIVAVTVSYQTIMNVEKLY